MISLYRPGSPGGEMKCPTCGARTPDDWKRLVVQCGFHPGVPTIYQLTAPQPEAQAVELDWMNCADEDCGELVIRIHEGRSVTAEGERGIEEFFQQTNTYLARPRFGVRNVEPEVPEPYRSDYLEAAALLDISPRMSAVLSRRLLYDLLQSYAQIAEYTLKGSIDKFVADTTQPRKIRENLHLLREMGDFGAHTQTDDQAKVVNVTKDEAVWTLDVIDRLFDYFIVAPEKNMALHKSWDEKLKATGRKPIPPLPEDAP